MDLVCFANDWSGDPLSKKHVMRRLAQRHRVLWVDSLGNRPPRVDSRDLGRVVHRLGRFARGVTQVEPNLWVMAPLAVPFYDSPALARVNAWLVGAAVRGAMRRLGFRRVINYSFVPAAAWVAGRLGESRVVYHCVDEYAHFAGAGPAIAALEARLLGRADLVITCSQALLESKRCLNPRTILVRHGVDQQHFARALDEHTPIPADLAALAAGRRVIGFHGLIAEWIDLALIRRVAEAFPEAAVVLIGDAKVSLEPLANLANVHVLGRRAYDELPGYCRGFDVALLPFTVDELTRHANPLKLREYLAAGLPVIATDIPEARELPEVRVATDADSFIGAVREALRAPDSPSVRQARSATMQDHSWDARVAEIEARLAAL